MVIDDEDDYYSNNWTSLVKSLKQKNVVDRNAASSLKAMIASPDTENTLVASEIIKHKIRDPLTKDLNEGQTNAFHAIADFCNGALEADAVVLKGYAGTGKTYLVKRVLEYLVRSFPGHKVAITAPTNKAVHVLARNSPYSDKSAIFEDYADSNHTIVYCTVHRLLNKKEVITDSGKQLFVADKLSVKIKEYSFLIVDEVSMLDDGLFEEIMVHHKDLKIIFLGDPAQIPPVNKEFSPPLRAKSPFNLLHLQLDEIMRQGSGNPLIEASMILRQNLMAEKPLGELQTQVNEKNEGIVRIHSVTDRHKVRPLLGKLFTHPDYIANSNFCKILAWRNKTVTYLNNTVRSILFNNTKAPYVVGERLIANKPLFTKVVDRFGIRFKIKAHTSDEFVVTWVSVITTEFDEIGTIPRQYLKFWKLTARNVSTENTVNLYVIHEESAAAYKLLCKEAREIAKNLKTSEAWVEYYNLMKHSDNLSYAYAITVHKSQGSTYDYTLFIEEDLDKNRKTFERNRIKYTAYTRARKKTFVLV